MKISSYCLSVDRKFTWWIFSSLHVRGNSSHVCQILLTALFILLLGIQQSQAQEILIGRTLPLTGPLANYGLARQQGADLMIEQQNLQGGIAGKKLKVITLDDQNDPAKGVANVRKLDAEHQVLFMLNSFGVPVVAQIMPVLEELKLPGIGFSSGAASLREPFRRYVFPMAAGYKEEAEFTARQLVSVNVKRVALLEQPDAFSKTVADAYRAAFDKYALTLVATVGINRDAPDASKAVADLKPSAPQAILLALNAKPAAAFIQEYRKTRGGSYVYAMSVTDASQLAKIAGEDSRGVGFSQVVPLPTSKSKRVIREYITQCEGKKLQPTFYGLASYLEAKIAIEAVRTATKPLTRESLIQALKSMARYDMGGYEVSYGKNSRLGSKFVEMVIIGAGGRLLN
jgi:branched-chain amino acid transport system substrate-binding protein